MKPDKITKKSINAIIIASYGTTSTGINIPTLENIIFASPTSSIIRVLQSIGRGLRVTKTKTKCKLFDIVDHINCLGKDNITYRQGITRLKIYNDEEFQIKTIKVKI